MRLLLTPVIVIDWLIFWGSMALVVSNLRTLWRAFLYQRYGQGLLVPVMFVRHSYLVFMAGSLVGFISFATGCVLIRRALAHPTGALSAESSLDDSFRKAA